MSRKSDKLEFVFTLLMMIVLMVIPQARGSMTSTTFKDDANTAKLQVDHMDGTKSYTLTTTAPLRDNEPADKTRTFAEKPGYPTIRTGNEFFDALYALTLDDARLNAVDQIRDGSFEVRDTMNHPFFQTGQKWTYVWTRDISYSVDLGLASLDPQRCMNSLLFKTTRLKPGIEGQYSRQIVQDTGSGGSYPVSTDRVVWAIGAWELLKYLDGDQRAAFLEDAWQIMHDTIEHDRCVIFDPDDGLYRGEQSFLDWRQQSYPGWTKDNVLAIAKSKTLSTNIGHHQLLKTAAELAGQKGLGDLQDRYTAWADALKNAINKEFYVESKGLYSSIILDEPVKIRLNRFDLLGQSLAILCGIADQARSQIIIANYPQSKYGPPVVWPQEQTVPIYHNHAYWPFVTAYWLKAARQAGNGAAVDQAIYSLVRGTALNLSNMENFDFVTGNAYAEINGISGPVINSQRQLWSVAGYMSMAQDIVFGLETDWDGIRFLPCITPGMHREYFEGSRSLTLKDFKYHGKTIQLTVNLPSANNVESGIYKIEKIKLNNETIGTDFVSADLLKNRNHWEVWLSAAGNKASDEINLVNDLSRRNIFGPKQPRWKADGGITVDDGKLKLYYDANGEINVCFNIYRNGQLCAEAITETEWTDPDSADYPDNTYFYRIEAVYPDSGNCSHVTPARAYHAKDDRIEIGSASIKNKGGNLAGGHFFENWGLPEHELQTSAFTVNKSGTYLINAEYSNGAGPINTGVTCAVKRFEILELDSSKLVATSYLIMPHTADWTRYLDSSSFQADLKEGQKYAVKIYEDVYARNMSYFDHYECYKSTGNGTKPYNYVNISKIRLIRLKD
ncbi:MAG: hypothetical protein H8E62_07910 [Planctomycetes bacterium]|nr:hypothetical protein [Planctomycetota bacterium]